MAIKIQWASQAKLAALALSIASVSPAFAQVSTPTFGRNYTNYHRPYAPAIETETVRERFADGKVHIERQVAQDTDGNYVNQGKFQEFNANGEVIISGQFEKGRRQGPWVRTLAANDSTLFQSYPYNKFTAPFRSIVDFADDKMDGIWIIQDANDRIISQISLQDGIRHGTSSWFHPNGEIQFQAEYVHGALSGPFCEKDAQGKIVRQNEYVDGHHVSTETEFYPNKNVKSETEFLSTNNIMVSPDDFEKTLLAVYEPKGDKVRHGIQRILFENGQQKSIAHYVNGRLDGTFESFFANGQKSAAGVYRAGNQVGKWIWWHDNGMRKAVANYVDGQVQGEVIAWNPAGQKIQGQPALAPNVTMQEGSEFDRQIPVRTKNTLLKQ